MQTQSWESLGLGGAGSGLRTGVLDDFGCDGYHRVGGLQDPWEIQWVTSVGGLIRYCQSASRKSFPACNPEYSQPSTLIWCTTQAVTQDGPRFVLKGAYIRPPPNLYA